jgi:hypothetical protein
MNKEDEYWFWVMKAITEPITSNLYFFWDEKEDLLFATIINENNNFEPFIRTSFMGNRDEVILTMNYEILKVKDMDPSIIKLTRLSLQEKKDFFYDFILTISDQELRATLLDEINILTESDSFNLKTDLKSINRPLYIRYDMARGKFIVSKIAKYYTSLGISEESTLLW